MAVAMVKPTRHSKSGVYRVRLSIPPEMADTAQRLFCVRSELVQSLKTKDLRQAVRDAPAALAELTSKLETIRAAHSGRGRRLSHREILALAGEHYATLNRRHEDDPRGKDWFNEQAGLENQADDLGDEAGIIYEPDAAALARAEGLLAGRHILADTASVRQLAAALWDAQISHTALMGRRASGDYGPDPVAATFPTMPAPSASAGPAVPIDDLVRGWGRDHGYDPDAKPVARNYYDRATTAARLIKFLGHDNAATVTKADAVRWKEGMKGKSLATVANDISEMSAVWRWGMSNGKVTENPFAGILPPKKARNRKQTRRAFTDDEAVKILTAARGEKGALRWLPWVLACTGARLTEIAQARKEDILTTDGRPFLRVHEDDDDREEGEARRSVKNESSIRNIPLHPKLIEEGFLKYVDTLPAGSPLWPTIAPDGVFGSRGIAAQKLISRWLRKKIGIEDERVSPAHSWRHFWITKARECEMHTELRDAITGHTDNRNEAHRYGTGWREMPARLAEAMAAIRLPNGL